MKQIKLSVGLLVISSCFITLLVHYWYQSQLTDIRYHHHRPTVSTDRHEVRTPTIFVTVHGVKDVLTKAHSDYDVKPYDASQDLALDTPGCQIPSQKVKYKTAIDKGKRNENCGTRAVYLKKVDKDRVQVNIKIRSMKRYLRKSIIFYCCYRFIRTDAKNRIQYSSCRKIHDATTILLEADFLNVRCFEYDRRNSSHLVYEDVYAFTKKSNSSTTKKRCKMKYNVLMLGMDTMSLSRLSQTMPKTYYFLNENLWNGFRGYHKVGDNTFPNLMAALAGKNLSTIMDKCTRNMDSCNDLLIWSKFRDAGYITAYGEDYLRLPDTFSKNYAFKTPPTDHYIRPFYQKGEKEYSNMSLVCAGELPSAKHLLDYALDFVETYREDNFFGMFWINSFSHNINSKPQNADTIFENFFNQITYSGALENTFVIFFSDHGIRFGDYRMQFESYYDDRMPYLFMYVPQSFKELYSNKYKSLVVNQNRLITPYDLYITLTDILQISDCNNSNDSITALDACPKCQSIFTEVDDKRTCQDVSIHGKWCSCHQLYPLDVEDPEGMKAVSLVISHIRKIIESVKTRRCWGCLKALLKNVIRINYYYNNEGIYYVVAFAMAHGNLAYEATVLKSKDKTEIVGPVSAISPYRGLGKCTIKPRDRLFCVCQRVDNCSV